MIRRGALVCLALCSACATADDAQPVPVGRPDTSVGVVVPETGAPDTGAAEDTAAVSIDTAIEVADVDPEDSVVVLLDSEAEDTALADTSPPDTSTVETSVADTSDSSLTDAIVAEADAVSSDAVVDSMEPETDGETCVAPCPTPPYEIEPNNTLATATPLWPSTSTWIGAIEPYGDLDYFTFTLTAPAVVDLVTHNVAAPMLCSHDTVIRLYDATGVELNSDDDSGIGTCSHIKGTTPLAAGKYFVSVHEFGDNATISGYQLDVIIK